jgi:hypothetical protein
MAIGSRDTNTPSQICQTSTALIEIFLEPKVGPGRHALPNKTRWFPGLYQGVSDDRWAALLDFWWRWFLIAAISRGHSKPMIGGSVERALGVRSACGQQPSAEAPGNRGTLCRFVFNNKHERMQTIEEIIYQAKP